MFVEFQFQDVVLDSFGQGQASTGAMHSHSRSQANGAKALHGPKIEGVFHLPLPTAELKGDQERV